MLPLSNPDISGDIQIMLFLLVCQGCNSCGNKMSHITICSSEMVLDNKCVKLQGELWRCLHGEQDQHPHNLIQNAYLCYSAFKEQICSPCLLLPFTLFHYSQFKLSPFRYSFKGQDAHHIHFYPDTKCIQNIVCWGVLTHLRHWTNYY